MNAPEARMSVPREPPQGAGGAATTVVIIVVAIAALYFGRELFIPFALAVLLSFAVAPFARLLRVLGRVLSVLIAVTVAFAVIAGLSVVVGGQVVQLATNLPSYQQNIEEKIASLRPDAEGGVLGRAARTLRELQRDIADESQDRSLESARGPAPVPVQIREPPTTALDVIRNVAVPLLAPVVTAGLMIVFTIFMLLERENMRDRFIALVGRGEMHVTTEALDEAARRVSRYLLMQLVVNVSYGVPLALGLWLIGVPNAALWGVLAALLRFLPYLGPFIAALFPLALAFAVGPGWSMVLWTLALIATLELLSNNFVEPWLYGASTGLSAIAVILAAIFWTTLWGPVGLFLATPLTVCLAVMGRYVPALRFLHVLLGADQVLSPAERLYQRMLAGDVYEGEQIAVAYFKERSLIAFCDDVALPALRLAERDRARGALSLERQAVVTESLLGLVHELADYEEAETASDQPRSAWSGQAVACIGARTGLDTAAASLLAHLLERRGIGARVAPREVLNPGPLGTFSMKGVEVLCLVYLGASAEAHAGAHCRRLRKRAPDAHLLVGLWHADADGQSAEAGDIGADALVGSFAQMVAAVARLATASSEAPMVPAPIPPFETARLAELKRLGIGGKRLPALDRVTRELAEALEVPIALVTLIDEQHQLWPGACGLPADLEESRASARETSVCGHVVAADQPIVIEDVTKDKRFANNPFLRERGIRFYAGVPLRTRAGLPLGSLCVIDTAPRTITKGEQVLLRKFADQVMAEIECAAGPGRAQAPAPPQEGEPPAAGQR